MPQEPLLPMFFSFLLRLLPNKRSEFDHGVSCSSIKKHSSIPPAPLPVNHNKIDDSTAIASPSRNVSMEAGSSSNAGTSHGGSGGSSDRLLTVAPRNLTFEVRQNKCEMQCYFMVINNTDGHLAFKVIRTSPPADRLTIRPFNGILQPHGYRIISVSRLRPEHNPPSLMQRTEQLVVEGVQVVKAASSNIVIPSKRYKGPGSKSLGERTKLIISYVTVPASTQTRKKTRLDGGRSSASAQGGGGGNDIKRLSDEAALSAMALMLRDGVYADITINTSDGHSIRAHRAVLSARSSVFRAMFSHAFSETVLSTVNITDMSPDAAEAFVRYLYGDCSSEDVAAHRVELFLAADKYDVPDLRTACGAILPARNINNKNVMELLQLAHLYSMPELKGNCMAYLELPNKIDEIRGAFAEFIGAADRDLVIETVEHICHQKQRER